MQIVAPRRLLTLAAACLIGAGVLIQWFFGFRSGEARGEVTEWLAYGLYAVALVLALVPLGRRHAWVAGGLGFILMAWAVHLNARYSTYLDQLSGGPYAWSGTRVLVATIFVGPMIGVVVGLLVGILARLEVVRFTPKAAS
jgi:hypothetical protein